jgi:hypothetical protein
MQKLLTALLFFTALQAVTAQTNPSLQDMQRRMLEMQKQLMQELQNNGMGGSFFSFPGGDSTYTFRFDTTITGDNFSGSFHFGPFGGDSTMRDNLFGSDWLNQFFGSGPDDDAWDQSEPREIPDENEGEHMLPEERLRLEEEQEKSGKSTPGKATPSDKKQADKPKIKTVRI